MIMTKKSENYCRERKKTPENLHHSLIKEFSLTGSQIFTMTITKQGRPPPTVPV